MKIRLDVKDCEEKITYLFALITKSWFVFYQKTIMIFLIGHIFDKLRIF